VRLARVLDDVQAVAAGDGQDLVEVGRHPADVDRDDRFRPGGDPLLDPSRVEVERARSMSTKTGTAP
jgi:hypothetical protein